RPGALRGPGRRRVARRTNGPEALPRGLQEGGRSEVLRSLPAVAAATAGGAAAGSGAVPGSDGAGDGAWTLWDAALTGLAATGVHTAAMLFAAGVAALIAYDFPGAHAPRWRGVTMDRIWAMTLVLGGLFVLWSIR
ncbi:hypothetical protein ACFWTE_29960, partial [Nocardiopsis sp. NPDC058631]